MKNINPANGKQISEISFASEEDVNEAVKAASEAFKPWADMKGVERGEDNYELVQEAPLIDGRATVNVGDDPSDFYKVVIEGPKNSINRWVVEE
jgi:hypothetical protein